MTIETLEKRAKSSHPKSVILVEPDIILRLLEANKRATEALNSIASLTVTDNEKHTDKKYWLELIEKHPHSCADTLVNDTVKARETLLAMDLLLKNK